MIDIAKVVDLVFLLIDGSFGFEMEIFEFLNICQVSYTCRNNGGFPLAACLFNYFCFSTGSRYAKNNGHTNAFRYVEK